nr:LysR substrate-binding domain-containing protein [Caballeronia sp. ATUFL_M2_KS44]
MLSKPFIRYDRDVVGGQLADAYLRQHGIKPHQRCELDGLAAIATLVDRGLGVSLVPDWAPTEYAAISVRKWPLPHVAPKRLVGLIWAARARASGSCTPFSTRRNPSNGRGRRSRNRSDRRASLTSGSKNFYALKLAATRRGIGTRWP